MWENDKGRPDLGSLYQTCRYPAVIERTAWLQIITTCTLADIAPSSASPTPYAPPTRFPGPNPAQNPHRKPSRELRYGTHEDIEKRFNSGLTMVQKEHCMDRYPDAPARIELLIDLTIWVAQASHSLLVTGKVRRVLRYGSVVYLGYRGWGWSELGPFTSSCVPPLAGAAAGDAPRPRAGVQPRLVALGQPR